MRAALGLVAAAATLGGCASTPSDFAVLGSMGAPGDEAFVNRDPAINAALAQQACADGYTKTDDQTVAASKGSFSKWTLHCNAYHPSLF